jgi:hypothetical protein
VAAQQLDAESSPASLGALAGIEESIVKDRYLVTDSRPIKAPMDWSG